MSGKELMGLVGGAGLAILAASPAAWSQTAADAGTIEELRKVIELQQQQLELLMQKVDQLEESTAQAAAAQPADEQITAEVPYQDTPEALHKEPQVVASGQDRVKLSVSGQVNRAFLATDDGDEKDYFFVDNDNSSTRFRFIGDGLINDDLTVTAALELDAKSNSSSNVNQENEQAGASVGIRRAEVLLSSNTFGTGYLGRGWTASDSSAEVDLSGTDVVSYSGVADMAGGMRFRRKDGTLTAFNVFDMFDNLDGLGRNDRFRYDTPNFGGFSGAFSATTESNQWDAALLYGAEIGSFDVAGTVAYYKQGDDVVIDADGNPTSPSYADPARKDGWTGSASVLHDSGLNLTVAGGKANSERSVRDDPQYWYAKAGYIAQFWGIGSTNFSVSYWDGKGYVENDSKSKSWAITAVQQLDKYGTEFYASFRNYNPDTPTRIDPTTGNVRADLQDLKAFMLGARVKF